MTNLCSKVGVSTIKKCNFAGSKTMSSQMLPKTTCTKAKEKEGKEKRHRENMRKYVG